VSAVDLTVPAVGPPGARTGWRIWILGALFFASGFSALVYQSLWLRLLGLVFGVTIYSASTVLAAFMAGLALGAILAGRIADRVRNRLAWFGAAEILIGATALATPAALDWLTTAYQRLHAIVPGSPPALAALRLAGSFAVLIVPTTLMGATLPLVLRSASTQPSAFASRAALLYALNTAGAVIGTLAAGYYLIAAIGIQATLRTAAAISVLVGISSFFLSLGRQAEPMPREARPALPPPSAPGLDDRARRRVLVVFGISGFVALALEVVWFRMLLMFLPATTYVFTTMLAIVLGGIAAGSAIATPVLRRSRGWLPVLAWLEISIGAASLFSIAALGWTYTAGWRTGALVQASTLAMLPATLLMGTAFPIGLHLFVTGRTGAGERVGDRVARFYAMNVCGGIGGALAAGFVLIPLLGTRASLVLLSMVSVCAGLLLMQASAWPRRRQHATIVGSVVLVAAGAAAVRDPLDIVLARRYSSERVLWREEGAQATVSVHADGERRTLYLDGLHQANDSAEMIGVHRQIGTLAMALHPDPESALVIGLGGGATAGAVAAIAQGTVDVVELSPSVIRAARLFSHINGDILSRPDVRIRRDDGRNFLLLTPARYDVITADIIQPFHAGAGNLYSREYFTLARNALEPGGLMLQWIGHRPRSQYHLIMRTFIGVFPHATAWAGGTLMAGTLQPLRISKAAFERRLAEPSFADAMAALGVRNLEGLMAHYSAGAGEMRTFVGDGPVLSDDRPLVEYFMALPPGEPDADVGKLRGLPEGVVVP
jgi:spermidine synthase